MTTSEKRPSTRKLLVAFDPKKPDAGSGDFVVPVPGVDGVSLVGLRSGKRGGWGMMVFLGREVTANDLAARLADAGYQFEDVRAVLDRLGVYIEMLQDHRVGNVVALEPAENEVTGFRLTRVANTPSAAAASWQGKEGK